MRFKESQAEQIRDYALTFLILVLGLVLLVTRNDGGLHNLRKISIATLSYLDQPLANVRIYREALQTNTELRSQNVILLDELSRLRSAREQNEELKRLLDFERNNPPALHGVKVISKNLSGINNFITINAGLKDSVAIGMPVVNAEGLIGQVIMASDYFAQVMPYTNPLFRVSARVQGSRAYGIVSWDSDKLTELVMNYVPQTVFVEIGSIVETSGDSRQFPGNVPIGEVIRTEPEKGRETQRIYLRPYASLYDLAEAFVVLYRPSTELEALILNFERQLR